MINMDYGNNEIREIMAEVQGKYLVIEGDIIVGTVKAHLSKSAAILNNSSDRWPNSTIPYTIDPNLTDLNRITLAINHINDNTNLCIVPRGNETDYITFTPSDGCSSYIGRVGGQQAINLSSGCQWIETLHEILHAAGFYHEQSRADRDTYITVHTANILTGFEGNFNKYGSGQDIGTYDYGSIMHYLHYFFGCKVCGGVTDCDPTNDQSGCTTLSTLTKPDGSTDFGPDYTNGMSATDILGVNTVYPINANCTCDESMSGPSELCNGDVGNLVVTITGGTGPYNVTYTDGTNNFTINNYVSGTNISITPSTTTTYSLVSVIDTGDNNFDCGSNGQVMVTVYDEAGDAQINGSTSNYTVSECNSASTLNLSSTLTTLGPDQVIGWWLTEDQPISNILTNGNKVSSISSATIGGNLTNIVNHIYEANSGSPIENYSLSFNCGALNSNKSYFATPFISNKKAAILDVDCNVSASIANGTFNTFPARRARIISSQVCRPVSPPNVPIYTYTLSVTGFTGNTSNHYYCIFSPEQNECFVQLSGNGTYMIPASSQITDPGQETVDIWVWEQGGNGMSGASVSLTLNISYPGTPAINFPDISDVNSCTIGAPIQINCSCCSITNVTTTSATCNGYNAEFNVTGFTATDASGNYQVVNDNDVVVASGTGPNISVSISTSTPAGDNFFRVRDAANNSCISTPTAVSMMTCIHPCNTASNAPVSGTISTDTRRSSKTSLSSTANVTGGNVIFQANDAITLDPLFQVGGTGTLEVNMDDCDDSN